MEQTAMRDLYHVLEVSPDADEEAIKGAYRRLARRFHPDIYLGADATRKMQELNYAYEVLSDPQRRREYDTTRPKPRPPSRPAEPSQHSDRGQTTTYHGFPNKAAYDEAWRRHNERFAGYQPPSSGATRNTWQTRPEAYRFDTGRYRGRSVADLYNTEPGALWDILRYGSKDSDDGKAVRAFLRTQPDAIRFVRIERPPPVAFVVVAVASEMVFGWFSTTYFPSQKGITQRDDLGSYIFNIGVYTIAIAAFVSYGMVLLWRQIAARRRMQRLLSQ